MNLQQMSCFITVANHLSFTKAAEILYTSQPNVSRQISSLELSLGFQLLERSKNDVQLTPAGTIMLREFEIAIEHIESGINMALELNQGKRGRISIGYLESLQAELFMPNLTVPFQEKYPNVELSLESRSFLELRQRLNEGNLDVIFTFDFEAKNLNDISSVKAFQSKAIILMSSSHPLAQKENCSLSDFRDETFILPSALNSPGRLEDLNQICTKYGFDCDKIIYAPNLISQLFYVRSGMGVSLMDTSIVNIHEPYYRYIEIPIDPAPISIIAAWKNTNLNPTLSLFIKPLLEIHK